ncbi:glycosyltransferase family 2 protein [Leucobacter tardus]|uniref:Glycosyltransferase family 2 protein n=1 Tax=Leucobacter tardus TaxID=501483 RepID=A0A939QHQ4_9MICO|nr:glycosyltransferase family 2 protein [Leucobacter tardus]MBO2991075.1 glycosyltransferase family 2 protein [Leucobacter tardus]
MAESYDEERPSTRPVPIVTEPHASAQKGTVAAVIVTFNRLPKLPKTLETVLGQTYACDRVVVVNNNSTDGTREYLDGLNDERLDILHLDENLGGAGGFEHGMARGYNLGADFVWVMDDDCYPEPDALEILLDQREEASQALGREVPFACSLVKFTDGSLCEMNNPITTWDWPRAYLTGLNSMLITECTFVSVLVPRWAIAEHGLPLGEYFIWFDDKEYTKRLLREYGSGIIAMDSVVIHDMGVNAGVNYRHVDESNIWKFEKGTRNQASYRLRNQGRVSYLMYCRRIFLEMREGHVAKPIKKRMYQALKTARTFNPQPRFPDNPKYRR